jgi:hypothetical protein
MGQIGWPHLIILVVVILVIVAVVALVVSVGRFRR